MQFFCSICNVNITTTTHIAKESDDLFSTYCTECAVVDNNYLLTDESAFVKIILESIDVNAERTLFFKDYALFSIVEVLNNSTN